MDNCKIVFISNYYNHHQKYLADALFKNTNGSYRFIETERMSEERINMGWGGEDKPDYVMQSYASAEAAAECQKLIDKADIAIIGSAPEQLLQNRKKNGKIIFRYSERPLKKGFELIKYPYRWLKWHKNIPIGSKIYMLCASAYTSADFSKFGLYKNRSYRWGYFPEVKRYDDIDKIIEWKHPASILWVARLIEWKHPDASIEVAKRLKADGYRFIMSLIGNGELEERLKERIANEGLSDCVHMLGAMKPEQVREHMEQSEVFMFTSDRNEGWGAVLNEAMNSGCAVVASHAIGSVPFLLEDGVNGLIYKDGDIDGLYKKVKRLLDDRELRCRLGKNAYRTVSEVWSADEVAKRFLVLSNAILSGNKKTEPFSSGPCSKAKILKDDWYNE